MITSTLPSTIIVLVFLTGSSLGGEAGICDSGTCDAGPLEGAPPCEDSDANCPMWAKNGECAQNPAYMLGNCRKSCGVCGLDYKTAVKEARKLAKEDSLVCEDRSKHCPYWALNGECDNNPKFMFSECRKSCFVCGENEDESILENAPADGSDLGVARAKTGTQIIQDRLGRMRRYTNSIEMDFCKNQHENCTLRAASGDCKTEELSMKKDCGPACFSCEYVEFERRCPMGDLQNSWQSGDLDALFLRLSSEPYASENSVTVLSSPSTTDGPWVVLIDDFLSQEEAEILIELGEILGYAPSTGFVQKDRGHVSEQVKERTSTTAWCKDACAKNATAQAVAQRISNLVGLPDRNSEHLQLLRYEPGQFYTSHHDYIRAHYLRPQGVRVLTVYLYLTEVVEGGGTNFDKLNLTVTPKVGRVVVWPSVLNEDPDRKDPRTTHQALPVEAGLKYGANAWFHQRDYKKAEKSECHR